MLTTSSIIKTKLHLPYTRPELVHRPRLQEKITKGLQGPLTLVTAPAGFGKTTLLASYIKEQEQPVAWLSLDKSDNQVERFLQYLIAALQEVDTDIGHEAMQMLESSQQSEIEMILTSLINDLAATGDAIILVLDDYQFLKNLDIHNAITFLLEHCPTTFHLVIASRSDPPLPITRLRARAHLVELRASDLSFTDEEAAQFLTDVMGLQLDLSAIIMIKTRTEGWIAGLQMAALSMRDSGDTNRVIAEFSGTNRYILDYLLEEVLASQSPEIQRFLLSTSILDHLTAPLCDAVFDTEEETTGLETKPNSSQFEITNHSTSLLAYLEQANIFLVPLDAKRQWYRYHHLFADLLQTRLKMTVSREEINQLHVRAAKWFEKNGYAYEAIHHASLIPDDEWVERLIEQNYMEMFQRKDSASIWAWTGSLSREIILKSPKLSIHEAMSLSWVGRFHEAKLLLTEAEKHLRTKDATPENQALLGHLAYVKSRVTAMSGDFQQAIQLCLTAREFTPAENHALLGGIGVMLGYAYFLAGDFENASQVLIETIHSGKVSGAVNTTVGAYCVLGRLYALQGQLQQAFQTYQAAEKFVNEMGGQHRGAISIIQVGFAEVYYQWNDLDNAFAVMDKAQNLIHFWGKVDDIVFAHVLHAFMLQARGNLDSAVEAIESAQQVIHSSGVFAEARNAVQAAKIRLGLMRGDSIDITSWMSPLEEKWESSDCFDFENELLLITLARVYIAHNRLGDAERLLSQLADQARLEGRTSRVIEILVLKAVALQQMGNTQQALDMLQNSLILAEPERFVRIYLDEGQPIKALLLQWMQSTNNDSLKEYGTYLLSQFNEESHSVSAAQSPLEERLPAEANEELPEPLSQRELEVLQLIALGKTNLEIAKELIVARGTIKAHAASIYRKLDVTNRTEAVARARQLGILL